MRDDRHIMHVTLDIDDDVLQAASEIAQLRGVTTDAVVSDLLRKALRPAHPVQRVRNGVPLLTRRPGAPPLTVEMIKEMAEDD